MDRLTAAHIEVKLRLQRIAATVTGTTWDRLPHYDRQNVDEFLSTALPLLAGANLQSVAQTEAYIARALDRAPRGVDAAAIVAGIRNGTTPETLYTRPFVTVWAALSDGKPFDEAVALGRLRATTAAATDVQLAFRDSLPAIGEADHRLTGWRRVANANACEFCQRVSGAKVRRADPMPLHPHCGCGVEPLTSSFEPSPTPADVAVHEHGEMGAYLGSPDHEFLSEHEALAR
jgi:hypothetical protein